MLFKICHGLLECNNYPANKKSAIIFNDEFIITSAYILYPYLRKYDTAITTVHRASVIENLRNGTIIDKNNDFLQTLQFEITYDQNKMEAKTKTLLRFKAEVLHIFNCPDILASKENILNKLTDASENDEVSSYNGDLHKLMVSSFILLRLVNAEPKENNFKMFLTQIKNYIKFIDPVNKLDDVLTISTPFGMESFYKTINIGKVSNVFGTGSCVFTISSNLVTGCEGAAVINSRLRLIGIITCTTFRWNNETANFTLAANFRYVLKEFLQQIGVSFSNGIRSRKLTPPYWENAVVLLQNEGSWGTGILLKLKKAKFILTCSHVIKNPDDKITCHYLNGSADTNLLWKNPHYNQPYDIAVIQAPVNIPDKYFLQISETLPHLGQTIFSAGFPLISHLGKEMFRPSLYEGRIIKFSPGMIISDASVQAGQSGGPLLDSNGRLLGVCVSNSKDHETNTIYPNINMAIPVFKIRKILENYAKTNDVNVLNNLIAGSDIQEVWALKGPLVESKL